MMLLASAAVCVASGCVGERADDGVDAGEERAANRGTVVSDTVAPVGYQVFDSVVHSQDPRKVEFRLLALRNADRPSLVKTLRSVLDSISQSDSVLVAARGVLYLYDASAPGRGNVVPRLWGEWVPPVGWDSANAASRGMPHVIYTYNLPAPESPPRTTE
jgi:hypothetical protein